MVVRSFVFIFLRYVYPGIKRIVHGREDHKLADFEKVLTQFEPMISATIRKLNIYRNHEQFRQAGRVALWQAWTRFEEGKGIFAAYASRSIRGAMLDLIKSENQFEENVMQAEDDLLLDLADQDVALPIYDGWSDKLSEAFEQLTENEKLLIQWIFVEGLTQAECAERANLSVAGIKKRRERMIVKLRKLLG